MATRHIEEGVILYDLCGQLYPVNKDFLIPGVNDFSTVVSSRTKREFMFLGPVAFVNHDCSPNAVWHSRAINESCVRTIKEIDPGQEITVFYGWNFFGAGNKDCQCITCENKGDGYFASKGK